MCCTHDSEHKALTLRLLVTVVKDDVSGVVDACGEIHHGAFAKLVDSEDNVIDIGDPIDVVLKYVYTEWMEQVWKRAEAKRDGLERGKRTDNTLMPD